MKAEERCSVDAANERKSEGERRDEREKEQRGNANSLFADS